MYAFTLWRKENLIMKAVSLLPWFHFDDVFCTLLASVHLLRWHSQWSVQKVQGRIRVYNSLWRFYQAIYVVVRSTTPKPTQLACEVYYHHSRHLDGIYAFDVDAFFITTKWYAIWWFSYAVPSRKTYSVAIAYTVKRLFR